MSCSRLKILCVLCNLLAKLVLAHCQLNFAQSANGRPRALFDPDLHWDSARLALKRASRSMTLRRGACVEHRADSQLLEQLLAESAPARPTSWLPYGL